VSINLTPLKRDGRKVAWICVQHPISGKNSPSTSYEISTFQHDLQITRPCLVNIRIIHCRPSRNLYIYGARQKQRI